MTSSGRGMRRWLVVVAVIAMVAVPTAAVFEPRPARFGWQIFTAMAPLPAAWVETADGNERPVDVEVLDPPLRGAAMMWDDSCGFCGAWVRVFRRLDWLHGIRDVPSSDGRELAALQIPHEEADRALQLVRDGRRSQGFAAVVSVAELLPVSFLWAPLLRVPPIAWAGDRLYRRVAARRSCALPLDAA